ncbi:hypothetical protein QBC35DRAFT_121378 [Podospora australis]|uniref:Rhodopsin domain-containing protein n=1 Tax=Podospora australis TaxID=1536484 RepID=A0AAN6WKU5_9PEZI|nr:hypothetical protein QBC35DRAFT_121378 [Podospora australis]
MDPANTSGGSGSASGPPPGFAGPPDPRMIPSVPTEAANALAHSFTAAAVALNVISFLLFSGRIYTRAFPVFHMGWDDYVIGAAWALILANSVLLILTVPYTFGGDPNAFTLADVIYSNKLAVLSQPIWAWSMAAIKISVAGMLLRLERRKPVRNFLYVMVALQVVVCVYSTIAAVLQCIPLRAAWDLMGLVKDAKCWSKHAIRVNSICVASFNIVTDVIFALMPVSFLAKVQIPVRERVVIAMLMGLGIFASAASIVKAVIAANFGKTLDPNLEGISMGTWSVVEEQVAFIAACIPCLRKPFQQLLQRLGLVTVVGSSAKKTGPSGYGRMGDYTGKHTHNNNTNNAIRMKNLSTSSRAQSEEDILADARKEGGATVAESEIWRTTEVRVDLEQGQQEAAMARREKWLPGKE